MFNADCQRDGLCIIKKEQNLIANILTTTKDVKKWLLNFVHNGVGYGLRQVYDKKSCFGEGVAFRVKVPPLDAIFWPVRKIAHNSFKNRTIQTGMPLPKGIKSMVFRHEKFYKNG